MSVARLASVDLRQCRRCATEGAGGGHAVLQQGNSNDHRKAENYALRAVFLEVRAGRRGAARPALGACVRFIEKCTRIRF